MLPGATTLRGPLSCLNEARYGIVWGAVGAGRACFETALDYAKERDRVREADLGVPADPAEARRDGARAQPRRCCRPPRRADERRGHLAPEHVSLGKMGNVRGAIEVCRSARTILGANGVTLEYPVIRHMNNLESVLTYEGTHEVHTLVVGQALTGESAFR